MSFATWRDNRLALNVDRLVFSPMMRYRPPRRRGRYVNAHRHGSARFGAGRRGDATRLRSEIESMRRRIPGGTIIHDGIPSENNFSERNCGAPVFACFVGALGNTAAPRRRKQHRTDMYDSVRSLACNSRNLGVNMKARFFILSVAPGTPARCRGSLPLR